MPPLGPRRDVGKHRLEPRGSEKLLTWVLRPSDSSAHGACGTYLWPGKTQRSMYRCFASPTIISMIDKPQFVIDASRSSTSHPTSSKTASPTPTDPSGGNDDDDNDGDSGSGTNIGAIVGGVIGGVTGLAFIAGVIAWLVIRTKARRRSSGRRNQAYNPVPPSDSTSPGSGGPLLPAYQAYQQPSLMSQPGGGGGGATTFPPTSPYPGGDHHRYASLFSQEPTPSPPPVYGYPVGKPAGSPDPPHVGGGYVAVNELDSGAVPAGYQSNPVEMGAGR